MPDSDKHTPKIEERDRELRQRIVSVVFDSDDLLEEDDREAIDGKIAAYREACQADLLKSYEALTATFAELLDELEEYFGDRMDVTDDEHGGVRPNQAMRFHQRIGEIKRRT